MVTWGRALPTNGEFAPGAYPFSGGPNRLRSGAFPAKKGVFDGKKRLIPMFH